MRRDPTRNFPRSDPQISSLLQGEEEKAGSQNVIHTRSITMAMPCPTPMHMVHSA